MMFSRLLKVLTIPAYKAKGKIVLAGFTILDKIITAKVYTTWWKLSDLPKVLQLPYHIHGRTTL